MADTYDIFSGRIPAECAISRNVAVTETPPMLNERVGNFFGNGAFFQPRSQIVKSRVRIGNSRRVGIERRKITRDRAFQTGQQNFNVVHKNFT